MRWDLLDRYLKGSCDEAERSEVLRWAAASAQHRQALDELTKAFRETDHTPSVRVEWERLRRALDREDQSGDAEDEGSDPA